jgi:hypothetical protein
MNLRDLWLAKAVVDLGLYAARGIQRLVRGATKSEPEPEEPSQPLSHSDVDYIEATIDRGARAFPTPASSSKPQPDTPLKK